MSKDHGNHAKFVTKFPAVIHQVDSSEQWCEIGQGDWFDLTVEATQNSPMGSDVAHSTSTSGPSALRIHGTSESGNLFELLISPTQYRWGCDPNGRFCTLQKRGEKTGSYGFYFEDTQSAEKTTEILVQYIPQKPQKKPPPPRISSLQSANVSMAVSSTQNLGTTQGQTTTEPAGQNQISTQQVAQPTQVSDTTNISTSSRNINESTAPHHKTSLSSEGESRMRHRIAKNLPFTRSWRRMRTDGETQQGGGSAGSGDLPSFDPDNIKHVSKPLDVEHLEHVAYDPSKAAYVGLPQDWRSKVSQFGAPLMSYPKRFISPYGPIPAVLELLKREFLHNDGPQREGIFRLAPDKSKCEEVKQRINSGTFTSGEGACGDVNVLANLIKVWFRELQPVPLLNNIPESVLMQAAEGSEEDVGNCIAESMPAPVAALFLWLLDVMVQVTNRQSENKMTPRNMAIVVAPNLYYANTDNPMRDMEHTQKAADFTYKALLWRTSHPEALPETVARAAEEAAVHYQHDHGEEQTTIQASFA